MRKVQHNNFPSAISKHSLALLFPKPEAVFAALSLIALTDLSAWNVSHCFVNQLYFCYSQCLAALCFTKHRISFCQLARKLRKSPNHGTSHRSLKILHSFITHLSSTLKRTTYLNFVWLTVLICNCVGPGIATLKRNEMVNTAWHMKRWILGEHFHTLWEIPQQLCLLNSPHSTAGLLNVTESPSPEFNFTFRMFPLQKPTTIPSFYKGCCWHGKRTVEVGQGKVLETAHENKVPSLPQALIPIWRVSTRCLTENTWQLSADEQSRSLSGLGTQSLSSHSSQPQGHKHTSGRTWLQSCKNTLRLLWDGFVFSVAVWYLLLILKGLSCHTTLCSGASGLFTEECHHTLTSPK